VNALIWPLFHQSAWPQTIFVLEGTTGEGDALDCVRSVCVASASPSGGGKTGEGAALASVRLVGVGSARH
jgi:hypothetical protein